VSSARDVADRLRKRRKVEKVQTEEGVVYVRGLTGAERSEWVSRFVENDMSIKDRILGDQHIVALALCDEHGAALFDNFDDAFVCVCDWQHEYVAIAAAKVTDLSGMGAKSAEGEEKKS
jgi:hypothetical protein